MSYDYLIVGGGSAGSTLARRLSEDPNNKVCLLEAGPMDNSLIIKVPVGIIATMRSKKLNWSYWTEPQEHLNNREVFCPRGKTLGGSSSINAMLYVRGHRWDYDHWAELGNTGWSYDEVLPLFKRSENQERGADDYHGVGGGLNVADLRYRHGATESFVEAGQQAGLPLNDDFNGAEQEGVGYYQVTQKDGERWSAARGQLHPVMNRPNLTVITGAMASRVLFDGKRATGVEYTRDGSTTTLRAEAQRVILSGGAINSPQLLLLSGVGPKAELDRHGISQVHELPGVGENLQDHLDVIAVTKSTQLTNNLNFSPLALPNSTKSAAIYAAKRTGPLTSNVAESGAFLKSDEEQDIPDLQIHMTAAPLDGHGLNFPFMMQPAYSCHICDLRPRSRGTVRLKSSNPAEPAAIDPRYLSDPSDVQRLLKGIKKVREILAQPAFDECRGEEIFPGKNVQTDEQLIDFIRRKADTIYHPVGTCKMGNDEMAVVDPELKVHGMENLWVIDASIMPTLVGGNTNAPTVMIAQKGADMILAENQG
ncbi:GMC family oxidoreductase [Bacterioplanoides sp.]|uniref:GMC family oxidoreductase n=1 Tax=Bacterioplanoides sp. TaxID=2066072 RepID=UPI003B0050A7